MPPHLKYATDSVPGKQLGLHYTAPDDANYAGRPRKRGSTAAYAPKIVRIFFKLRKPG